MLTLLSLPVSVPGQSLSPSRPPSSPSPVKVIPPGPPVPSSPPGPPDHRWDGPGHQPPPPPRRVQVLSAVNYDVLAVPPDVTVTVQGRLPAPSRHSAVQGFYPPRGLQDLSASGYVSRSVHRKRAPRYPPALLPPRPHHVVSQGVPAPQSPARPVSPPLKRTSESAGNK